MNESGLFHGVSTVVPGFWLVLLLTAVLAEPSVLSSLAADSQLSQLGIALVAGVFAGYVIGLLLWHAGHVIGPVWNTAGLYWCVFQLCGKKSDIASEWKDQRLHYVERLAEAKSVANRYALEPFSSYHDWRLTLHKALEGLPQAIGPRLQSEWELLGVLQALSLATLVALIVEIGRATAYPSHVGVLAGQVGVAGSLLLFLLLVLGFAFAYQFRNSTLGREVVRAAYMLSTGTSTPNKPLHPILGSDASRRRSGG